MAECNVSIDQKKLPGVKEVCRDFAVLEDHCLAYNLQEQEIESHLASNVHKSRLVQTDLQVAKRLQEEEDERAKAQSQIKQRDIERQDNEIALEIQDQLVRQAEQQRQQEEKDAAIARKLQEKEMKEERKRQKQLESNFEEEYFEDHGAARKPLDLDRHTRHKSTSPGRYDVYAPVSSHRDYSPDYSSTEPKRSRYPKLDSAAPHGRSKYPEHFLTAEGGRSRHADPYPEHLLPSRGKHGDRYPEYEPTQTGRNRDPVREDPDRVVRRKERPARPPLPHSPIERDKGWDGERDRQPDKDRGRDQELERQVGKDHRRGREHDLKWAQAGGRDRERSRDRGRSVDRYQEKEKQRQKDKDRHRARTRSRERGLEEDCLKPGPSRDCLRNNRASWEVEEDDGEREKRAKGRQRVQSGPEEVFDKLRHGEGRGGTREFWDPRHGEDPSRGRSHSHPYGETGRVVHRGSGAVIPGSEYGVSEATKGLTKLELRELELKDMEVARKLQEEEIKANSMHVRAAQVAQDEEIARLLMEQEKKDYKKNREREKDKERERDREREREREKLAMEKMAMERKRQEGEYRPNSEEVVRPRTREEYDYQRQRNQNKPARPPQPRTHDYENVHSPYGYSDHAVAPRAPTRPEAAYKGAYYKQ
ncbi:coiled-coil domain-containing protein 50 isoform X1 [Parambassis ranga]|uniref:Coiled-coil domain-containing protein 50 isoform X1 n=1 Tax=Parambassis ranga TaxID=210632 RepID=A0A6P7HXI5_9TELE|nr:zinc finger CCCH domain-containing protein 13-like isoform X1 [Parambassis ranga]